MKDKKNGPKFDCDIELQRSTKCSIIRLFDILGEKQEISYGSLFKSFNYMTKCDFHKLLNCDTDYMKNAYNSITRLFEVILVNYDVNPMKVVPNEQLRILFCFVKKTFNSFRLQRDVFSAKDAPNHRSSIVEFLSFLKRFVFQVCEFCSQNTSMNLNLYEVLSFILKELRDLLFFVGRTSQFRKEALTTLHLQPDPTAYLYNHYHTTLDIWWTTVEISWIVQRQTNYSFHEIVLFQDSSTLKQNPLFQKVPLLEQTLRLLFYDLHILTFDNFKNFNQNCYHQSSFPCTCCWEVYIMIKLMLHKQQQQAKIDTFYTFYSSTLSLFLHKSQNCRVLGQEIYQEGFENFCYDLTLQSVQEGNLFVLWQFLNISPLLSLDIDDENCIFRLQDTQVPIPDFVSKILRSILSKPPPNSASRTRESVQEESDIKLLLILTIKTFEYIPVLNLDLAILFLDYYFKRLNWNFGAFQANSIENYAFLPKDSLDWLENIRSVDCDLLDPNGFDNSFHLFLRFLKSSITQVQRLENSKVILQRLAGRIHISLQPKTLQSLELIGIFHVFTIFLNILTVTKDSTFQKLFRDKIISSLNEIMKNFSKAESLNITLAELIIKFKFTVLLINSKEAILYDGGDDKEKNGSSFLEESLNIFNSLSQEFQTRDPKNHYRLLKLFFDSVQDLLRKSGSSKVSILLIETLVSKIDFSKIYHCFRVMKRPNDMFKSFEHVKIIEFLTGILEYSCTIENEDKTMILTKMEAFLKNDLIKHFNVNDSSPIATFGYHLSRLQIQNLGNSLVEILNFSKSSSTFQMEYLCLVFEDSELCQVLKNSNGESIKVVNSTIMDIWLKCLPILNENNSIKIWLFTRRFFAIFYDEIQLENGRNVQDNILDSFDKYLDYCKFHYEDSRIVISQQINGLIKECVACKQNTLVLRIISHIVDKLAGVLYQIGKSDSPMVLIFESFLQRPLKVSTLPNEQSLIVNAIVQIFNRIFQLQIKGDSYLQRKVHQMTQVFLPQLVEVFTFSKLKFQFRSFYPIWCEMVASSLEKYFLTSISSLLPSKALTEYLTEFCDSEMDNLTNHCAVMIKNLNLGETLATHQSQFVKKLFGSAIRKLQTPEQRQEFIDKVLALFMQQNFCSRPVKAFETFRFLLGQNIHKEHLLLFHEICSAVYRFIDRTEVNSVSGQNTVLRSLYRDFMKQYS